MLTAPSPRPEHRTQLLLQALRGGRALSGSELLARCGFPGRGGAEWLETLLQSSLLVSVGRSDRRRPRDGALALNDEIGVLTADVGTDGIILELRDLGARRKATLASSTPRGGRTPSQVADQVDELYASAGQSLGDVRAVVVGLSPEIVHELAEPGADPTQLPPSFDLRSVVQGLGPREQVSVEGRAGLTALGRSTLRTDRATVLHVDIDLDIDAGVVTDGSVITGADRVGGALGHFVVPDRRDARCWCGNSGCLTAVAGGSALARRLGLPPGIDVVGRLLALERSGSVQACQALRGAGWEIGRALRSCATILDPDEIVVGGALGSSSPGLRWGISEIVESQHPATNCPIVYAAPTENVFALGATERAIHLALQRCVERPAAVAG